MFSSVAGGTGSGLGSRMLEEVKNEFQELNVVNINVFPFDIGENALQNYNTLLSLNSFINFSDYILYF
jgi:tubulin delta